MEGEITTTRKKRKYRKRKDKQDSVATEPDKTRQNSGLSQKQYNAIDAIIAGATDQEAARRCGVSRQTVNDWKNNDPEFMAELNQRREALWEEYVDQMRAMVGQSMQVLANILSGKYGWVSQKDAAFHVLKTASTYIKNARPKPPVKTDTASEQGSGQADLP